MREMCPLSLIVKWLSAGCSLNRQPRVRRQRGVQPFRSGTQPRRLETSFPDERPRVTSADARILKRTAIRVTPSDPNGSDAIVVDCKLVGCSSTAPRYLRATPRRAGRGGLAPLYSVCTPVTMSFGSSSKLSRFKGLGIDAKDAKCCIFKLLSIPKLDVAKSNLQRLPRSKLFVAFRVLHCTLQLTNGIRSSLGASTVPVGTDRKRHQRQLETCDPLRRRLAPLPPIESPERPFGRSNAQLTMRCGSRRLVQTSHLPH